ncbi:hypothetical protein [Maricaulis sp.]|uniref:hypothetical protein n=1 Tax=Maricaulis sp. TaxID=1486257 RepID=UPI00262E4A4C|nr:hypothetical protein [Maricaulis sp.]MDF1769427.1 hypothetical protein [Maricaulis sp.]
MWVRPLSLFLLGLETLHVLGWGLLLLISYRVGSDWGVHWVILREIATSSTHAQALAFILQVLAYPVAIALFVRRHVWAVPAACLASLASSADWIMKADQASYALLFSGIMPAVDVLALGVASVGTAGVAYCTLRRRLRGLATCLIHYHCRGPHSRGSVFPRLVYPASIRWIKRFGRLTNNHKLRQN